MAMDRNITRTVGCDVGDKYSHLCVLDEHGAVMERARVRTSAQALSVWFSGRPQSVVAMEVGAHSRWLEQLLTGLGHEVLVANARQVRLIYAGRKKTDRLDAEALARLARHDRRLLSPIRHRGRACHAKLNILRSRDSLVKARTSLINHVRGVAKSTGVRIPKCESASLPRRARPLLGAETLEALEPMLSAIEHMSAQIKICDKKIEQMGEHEIEAKGLMTINGVGALTAMAFILTLEDPNRFARSRDVGAYLGLVPKLDQSGNRDPDLRITKAGDGFVRKLLVQCAHHILGPHGRDTELRRFGLRLLERGGSRAKKKAVVAVARKLSVLMHRMWVTGAVYDEPADATSSAVAA
jgi:transposase